MVSNFTAFRRLNFALLWAMVVPLLAIGVMTAERVGAEEPGFQLSLGPNQNRLSRLEEKAARRSSLPYQPSARLPENLKALDYDSYRLIVYRHEKSIWKAEQLPFWLECFHRGYLYEDQVTLNLIEAGTTQRLDFDPRLFQYRGRLKNLTVPSELGFAGFRVLGRFEDSPHLLELASFLGGSYFRAIAAGQFYGTSARGLSIDIGLPKPEEFPVFREFWIERPANNAETLKLWALLDSPSVTGAYELKFQPGDVSVFDIQARLYFRRQPEKVGLAPMTSMWMWGKGRSAPQNDSRPEVHDADGLLVCTQEGEWIWRPLSQQGYPSLSHYGLAGVRGFGLMQRERDPHQYLDDEAHYQLRPSVWIEPLEDWPAGAVELLELPADHEGIDNIAAWWSMKQTVTPGQVLRLHYKVSFMPGEPAEHTLAKATAMRVIRLPEKARRIEIEFTGKPLSGVTDAAAVTPDVQAQRGTIGKLKCVRRSPESFQLSFELHPEGEAPMELRAVLRGGEVPLTETWRYLCRILPE